MNFGERLRHAREQIAHLTQKELETASGVSQKTISKLELGNQEGSTYVVQLALACGVRPEWLAIGEEPPVAPTPHEISNAYATGSAARRELIMRIAVLPDDGIDKLYPIIKAFSAQYD